jgi:glucosamine-6-phosphate deaminase
VGSEHLWQFRAGGAVVRIYPSGSALGQAAAASAATILRDAIAARGAARLIVGTGPSQNETLGALVRAPGIDWSRIEVFHMDEYVGMPSAHPASFRRWLREHVVDLVRPGRVHYLEGDAADLDAECLRYGGLLGASPIDISFLGFGENGHIAFNDPAVADFHDRAAVKRVRLDERCRRQQVGEGHFPGLASVPPEALTVTCPVLAGAAHLICSVPDLRKAEAVRNALEGPLSETCPASLVLTHPGCEIFLDTQSASLLNRARWEAI